MKGKTQFVIGLAICTVFFGASIYSVEHFLRKNDMAESPEVVSSEKLLRDPKNIEYRIDDEVFVLTNGKFEQQISQDSTNRVLVQLFGEPIFGDLDDDGDMDAAAILTYSGGGSGTFYYGTFAMLTDGVYTSTNTLFLGDRIAPQNIDIQDGRAVFNYAERLLDEPMTTSPSQAKSFWVKYNPETYKIEEWVKNAFVADEHTVLDKSVNTPPLTAHTWTWLRIERADGTVVPPQKLGIFTLIFKNDLTFSATTDCNGVGGDYSVTDSSLQFTNMISTLMYCEGSDEQIFTQMLSATSAYHMEANGELVFKLAGDGQAYFK
jgi:heat shock protein HslJ